jgi:DNA-binding MarR family transcriptional regulator
MAVVIGIVAHASHRGVFEDAARTLSGVTLHWITYEYEQDIRGQVAELLAARSLDGLLLGQMPYAKCRDLLPPDLQVTITRSAALDLSLALFRALARGLDPVPVSIDTFERETVEEVCRALDLTQSRIACLPYVPGQTAAEIAEFHRRSLAAAGGGYVISVRTGVVAELGGSVPVLTATPGPSTIRADLHELVLRSQSRRASALRFAAGVFLVAREHDPADLDRTRVGLMNLLVNTPGFADAWIENRGRRGVVVFAHQALFQQVTSNWVALPTLVEAEETLGIRLAAGFGVGSSARTCVQLAERAADRAEQEELPSGFLIEDSGVIIGPMGPGGSPLAYTYRQHGTGIEELARDVGLSPATLSRLVALERTLDGRAISPGDLAESLGITDPSGRRLIRKLNESGLVRVEGSAQVHRKGRPTRLYRLDIATAAARAAGGPEEP